MASARCKTAIFLITFCATGSIGSPDVVNFIISTIEELAARQTGIPECVFYDHALSKPFKGVLESVLLSPRLKLIPKLIINRDMKLEHLVIPREPIMLLIRARNMAYDDKSILHTLRTFNPNTKIIVLVNKTPSSDALKTCDRKTLQYSKSTSIIQILQHFNQNTQLIVLVNKDSKNFKIVETYVRMLAFHNVIYLDLSSSSLGVTGLNAKGMFEDSMRRNFTGSPLTFTKRQIEPDPFDPTFKWIQETAFYLNTTAVQSMHFCALSESDLQDDCYFDHFQTSKPTFFLNDPILLSVCGFERCSLYRASRWEKMVLMSLVLWMFFMTCAYETKFLSMLVYKPVEPKINTIQDLLKSSINLKANLLMSPDIEMETQLEGVVINSNDSEFEMDNTHAYIFEKMYIEPSLPYYYDTKTKTARYYKMDETLGSFVKGYVLSDRNPLLDLFGYTHVVFVESGIWNVWNSKYITSQGQFYHSTTDEILSFWDLVPAWAAFAFGCVMSGLVFVYEIVTLKCFHNRFRYVITSVLQ
ncbi:conserved hypothetical protein [Culex quinquefasciatus]|uniref:Ionotropic glutamate receptor L-glutamate and glycine-binding domain-containing protein n=1 Tax=Culex quinquefasciatus TaxID=7176 RepID=B0X4X6_CULQU|nr:conserved hypothetical protein [Culex quinquefasciatus]|eukprot:XP_001864698.1 conserved hypothetical protein [Culex quinquefasciatus]